MMSGKRFSAPDQDQDQDQDGYFFSESSIAQQMASHE
jgi:hypothetical protein